ncbi:hypothetical protein HY633_00390 [Candidatus Uhrbacteria bacterium]|nr:hypothetical protein [Candidatus Uhrbacteria bacterium]
MNFRKILIFILLLAVAGGIGFALYSLFFAPAAPTEVVNAPVTNAPPTTGLPEAGVGAPPTGVPARPGAPLPGVSAVARGGLTQVTPVAPVPTTGASVSASGALNYYNRADGKFYRVRPDGTVQSLSNKAFFNVDKATFDGGGGKAILEYPDGSNILYDFNSNTQVTLPKHWEDFNFSERGDKIAAKTMGVDPASRFLVISNPDGSGARAVQELGENADKVKVSWSPNNQVVGMAVTGDSFGVDRKEVFFIGANGENYKSMIVEGLDFRPEWNPSGDRLLYSVAGSLSDYKPGLWIVDAQGDDIGRNRRSLNVNTWADKCAFHDDNSLYCAVPQELTEGAGLQPAVADGTADDIYRIDLSTGLQTKIAVPEGSHTVDSMMVSPDGGSLFFTDKGSGIINKVMLK